MRLLLVCVLALVAVPVTAQAPPVAPALRSALEKAVKHAEALRLEMLATDAGKRYVAAVDVVRAIEALAPKPEAAPESK